MSDFLDVGGVNARIADFDKRHGANVFAEGWIRFEDGAVREADPLGLMMEPPADPYERARRQAHYRKIVCERAVRAFDQAKQQAASMAHANLNSEMCGPAPMVESVVTELKALQSRARDRQKRHTTKRSRQSKRQSQRGYGIAKYRTPRTGKRMKTH